MSKVFKILFIIGLIAVGANLICESQWLVFGVPENISTTYHITLKIAGLIGYIICLLCIFKKIDNEE